MAEIRTKDIINSAEVTKELQAVINKMNELLGIMKKNSSEFQKAAGSTKKLTAAEKEAAEVKKKVIIEERKLAKEFKESINATNKKIAATKKAAVGEEKARQKVIDKIAKERKSRLDLIRASRKEIKSDIDLNNKIKAQITLRAQADRSTIKGAASYKRMTSAIQQLKVSQITANKSIGKFNDNVGNYPNKMGAATSATGKFKNQLTILYNICPNAVKKSPNQSNIIKPLL
jgi:hypothetical protein